jgi:hypothetical protein
MKNASKTTYSKLRRVGRRRTSGGEVFTMDTSLQNVGDNWKT